MEHFLRYRSTVKSIRYPDPYLCLVTTELKSKTKANHKNNMQSYANSNILSSNLANFPPPGLYFSLGHTLFLFPSSLLALWTFSVSVHEQGIFLKSGEEYWQGRNTERDCIVSPHKVPVWLSAPCRSFRHGLHVLSIWWCKTHIWKRVRRSVEGLERQSDVLTPESQEAVIQQLSLKSLNTFVDSVGI